MVKAKDREEERTKSWKRRKKQTKGVWKWVVRGCEMSVWGGMGIKGRTKRRALLVYVGLCAVGVVC